MFEIVTAVTYSSIKESVSPKQEEEFAPGDIAVVDYPIAGHHGLEVTVISTIEDQTHGRLIKCTWKGEDGVARVHEYSVKILRKKWYE